MRTTIRRNVFETNSSTNHTYTFSVKSKKSLKKEEGIILSGFDRKADLVAWLFEEGYYEIDSVYQNGLLLCNNNLSFVDDPEPEFLEALCSLVSANPEEELESIYDRAKERVEQDEELYFANPKFHYMDYLKIVRGGLVKSTLPQKMVETLQCKLAMEILAVPDDTLYSVFEHLKDGELDLDDYLAIEIVDSQMLEIENLHQKAIEMIESISGKTISDIVESVGYIGFDGLLDDYYDFSAFEDELKISLHSYHEFEESLRKFLTDNNKVVIAK